MHYQEEALRLAQQISFTALEVKILSDFGHIFYTTKDYRKSLIYYEKCRAIAEVNHCRYELAICYHYIGVHLHKSRDYRGAHHNYSNAIEIYSEFFPRDHPKLINVSVNFQRARSQLE